MKQLLALLIGLVQCGFAFALGLDTPLQLLNHRSFTPIDGAPSSVLSLAQTSDGTLWVGGSTGLTRFDGARFVAYPAPGDDPLPSIGVTSLAATPDGGLWIGYLLGGATFLRAGRATNYGEGEGFPRGTTYQFAQDKSGVVWAATSTSLAHLSGQRWLPDGDSELFRSAVRAFLIDREGTQWVAGSEALFARSSGENRFHEVARGSFDLGATTAIAEAPNGDIWISANRDLLRIEHRREEPHGDSATPFRVATIRSMRPIAFDRLGNLWANDGGLFRVRSRELSQPSPWSGERLPASDGLSHDAISAILEDREGNVWIGTANGLDRFSSNTVVRVAVSCPPAAFAPGEAGAIWVRCQGARETTENRDGAVLRRHDTPPISAAYRDPGGTVWFGGPNLVAHFVDGRFVQVPSPPRAGDLPVQAIIRASDGAIWASFFLGTFRFKDGAWSENGDIDGLPRRGALAMALGAEGSLWFGYRDGRLARLKAGTVQTFDGRDGLDVGEILTIYSQGEVIWVGGALGLARVEGTGFVSIKGYPRTPLRGISGVTRSQSGGLWLNGIAGISHVTRESIDEAIRDPLHRLHAETFNHLDGVPGTAPQLRPVPSAFQGTDGRVWFATSLGIVSIDDSQIARNPLPPPVTIWALTSGAQRYRNVGETIELPVHTKRLEIEYSAGSLTVPERVTFRYRMEGLDGDWQEAGSRREAVYGNLGPGNYRFRVIASNNDGVWNETGASLNFTIAPAYYQTHWFYAACSLAGVGLLFAMYRLRLHQVSAQIRGRLEARLAERERIARELHDTLLQGIQGLILRFQAATDRIPPEEPARNLMEKSLDRADKLLSESRDKVKELRQAEGEVETLEQALTAEGAHFVEVHPAEFRVSVQGATLDLHPLVREEAFLIGREAISNAFQHSRALKIEVELTYGADALQIRIRDDGEGIASDLLAAGGRPGHFGLIGMRERTQKLGAHLEVWSKKGAGTEVELRVPSTVAYPAGQRSTGLRRLAAMLRLTVLPNRREMERVETST